MPPIALGLGPTGISFDPVHSRMYVTNYGGSFVSVIDTNNYVKLGADITVGNYPRGIAFASSIK